MRISTIAHSKIEELINRSLPNIIFLDSSDMELQRNFAKQLNYENLSSKNLVYYLVMKNEHEAELSAAGIGVLTDEGYRENHNLYYASPGLFAKITLLSIPLRKPIIKA